MYHSTCHCQHVTPYISLLSLTSHSLHVPHYICILFTWQSCKILKFLTFLSVTHSLFHTYELSLLKKKIMTFIEATNVVASRPPICQRVWDIPSICIWYAWNMPEIYLIFPLEMNEVYQRSTKISLAGSILWSILGPMKVHEGSLKYKNDHKRVPWCSEGLKNVFF